MTLDEWKAMQNKERTKVEFNIRKANEGTDSQWKKGYVLHKSKSEDVSIEIYVINTTCFIPWCKQDFDSVSPVTGTAQAFRGGCRRY